MSIEPKAQEPIGDKPSFEKYRISRMDLPAALVNDPPNDQLESWPNPPFD